jgi:hypothetical protein
MDCQWAVVDACAGLGDAACVDTWGVKAVGADDHRARFEHARAALALVGGAPRKGGDAGVPDGIDVEAHLIEAHRLSPFDPALAKRTSQPHSEGGALLSHRVRGARRAIAFGAPKAAQRALASAYESAADCRVCRVVYAISSADADEAARRAASAVNGKGPPLAFADALGVIDLLGGSPVDDAKKALDKLAKDERPEVREAVAQARSDQANPEARAARKAKQAKEAKSPAKPGTVPVPGGELPHR